MADVVYVAIRHYPPEAFGGAKCRVVKELSNIRHFRRKEIALLFVWRITKKNIWEEEKIILIICKVWPLVIYYEYDNGTKRRKS